MEKNLKFIMALLIIAISIPATAQYGHQQFEYQHDKSLVVRLHQNVLGKADTISLFFRRDICVTARDFCSTVKFERHMLKIKQGSDSLTISLLETDFHLGNNATKSIAIREDIFAVFARVQNQYVISIYPKGFDTKVGNKNVIIIPPKKKFHLGPQPGETEELTQTYEGLFEIKSAKKKKAEMLMNFSLLRIDYEVPVVAKVKYKGGKFTISQYHNDEEGFKSIFAEVNSNKDIKVLFTKNDTQVVLDIEQFRLLLKMF